MGHSLCKTVWKFFKRSNTVSSMRPGNSTARKMKTCAHADMSINIPNGLITVTRKWEKPTIYQPLNTWTNTVYMVKLLHELTSCTTPWVDPSKQAFMKDSRSQRTCAWLYLHGISRGKMRICGCLGLELGMGVPANEQGPLGDENTVNVDMVTIIKAAANTLRIAALCICECTVCHTSYTQWSCLEIDGLKNGERDGQPSRQGDKVFIVTCSLEGLGHMYLGAYGTIISTLLDIWKLL